MKRLISFILSIIFISGCAYNVKTNVDDFVVGTIEEKIKSTGVQELTPIELHQRYFQTLGAVETVACTYERGDRLPDLREMKKRLKVEAFESGANAMVFDSCKIFLNFQSCKQYQTCRAQIFDADI